MFLANALKTPDIIFFVLIAVLVVLVILGYFLISFFKRKMYAERRASLKERETQFRENLSTSLSDEENNSEALEEQLKERETPPTTLEEQEELNKEEQALETEQASEEELKAE